METPINKALQTFANLMIDKIKLLSDDKKARQPWFSMMGVGFPQNLSGRVYSGFNSFMLYLHREYKSYKLPVYLTFLQAQQEKVRVNKGEKSFPIVYWGFTYKDKKGNSISEDTYNNLSGEERTSCKKSGFLKSYSVFNIEQTNYPEVYPDKWAALKKRFAVPELKDDKNMLACPKMDLMLNDNAWLCPIHLRESKYAYYSIVKDEIVIPVKRQFIDGESFYSTILHEMSHSTGSEARLNRIAKDSVFGDPKYAKEELIAELTAALMCQSLGICSYVREENAQYLKSWLSSLQEEPKFIQTILSDVNKSSKMISDVLTKQELVLSGNKVYIDDNIYIKSSISDDKKTVTPAFSYHDLSEDVKKLIDAGNQVKYHCTVVNAGDTFGIPCRLFLEDKTLQCVPDIDPEIVPVPVVNLLTERQELWYYKDEEIDLLLEDRNKRDLLPEYAISDSPLYNFYRLYRDIPVLLNPDIKDIHIFSLNTWKSALGVTVKGIKQPYQRIAKSDIQLYLNNRGQGREEYEKAKELASKYYPAISFAASFAFFSAVIEKNVKELSQMKEIGISFAKNMLSAMSNKDYIPHEIKPILSELFSFQIKNQEPQSMMI